ncbi:HEAT repeat domain-containing protein [Novosphingobium sp. MW5]|nr:HEAT repeat domain-containing protein [Novosphingobium sp. MW5]
MRAALTDRSPQVRVAAAEALWRSGAAGEALAALTRLLDTGYSEPVRLQSLNVLTRMGTTAAPALPVIKSLTTIPGEYIPRAALYLVQVIEGTYDPYKPTFDAQAFFSRGGPTNPNGPNNQP